MPMQIDQLTLSTPLLLAPMAGYCDLAFRALARHIGGVGLASTDLLCPQGILREKISSLVLAASSGDDQPLAMQLYGSADDPLPEAARWVEDHGAAVVDINMGCPVDKITKRQGGSKLLCDPDSTLKMVQKVKAALRHTPLTCKLRLGWDNQHRVAPQLARQLEQLGVAAITIHGRTTEQAFSGSADLDGIAQVVAAVDKIPVIGNGDIRTPQDALRMMRHTRCAGVMIGRGALSRPWIFRDIWELLNGRPMPAEPSIEQKCQWMRHHFERHAATRGQAAAVREFRQRISWYSKTMHPCRELKLAMRLIQSKEDFDRALDEFITWRSNLPPAQPSRLSMAQ